MEIVSPRRHGDASSGRSPPLATTYDLCVGALAVMRLIKQAIDPENLMNPGKMLPLV
jgi:FAD/FMN-containing dehydrogenase